MTMASDGRLWVEMVGLSEEQVRRALRAAHIYLESTGAGIEEAFEASWQPEAHEFDRRWRMPADMRRLHDAWLAARNAALAATEATQAEDRWFHMFPADIGRERYASAVADLASGRALAVYPPPDPGPFYEFVPQMA